jgi:isopenicillin-N epimerase
MLSTSLPTADVPFGSALRALWPLDPDVHFLNHGSYGAAPHHVLAAQSAWREEMEREPVAFMLDTLPPALAAARERLARFVGATPSRLAFVENATAGVNAVLRSVAWRPGERVVLANHAYRAVRHTARWIAGRYGVEVVEARIPWPLADAGDVVAAYADALSGGARLAILDHIFSPLAIESPIESIVALCRAQGTDVLVDGAHAPAQIPLALDALVASGADWYAGNCHKWLCAPKGCGFLVASERGQRHLHPPVISNFFGEGFEREFAWTGTVDPSARLAVVPAIEFLEALGLERYRDRLRVIAREGAALIAEAWNVAPGAPSDLFHAMVALPFPATDAATQENALRWRARLVAAHRVEVPIFVIDGRMWVRISGQVYNTLNDYRALAEAMNPR